MKGKLFALAIAVMMLAGCSRPTGGQTANTEAPASDPPQTASAVSEPAETENGSAQESSAPQESAGADAPVVYMTTDISAEGLMAVYEALGASPEGSIAVKLSTGEPGSNYLRTDLIGDLVRSLNATIVECNTAYGGSRSNTAGKGGSMWSAPHDPFLESMAEAGKSVVDALGGHILYINVMNRLSVDCDCDSNPAEPDMHDIGILASFDPVAVDQACIDLVYGAEDGQSLIARIESRNGLHTLEHAERIGLGSRTYRLESIDD